MDLLKFTIEGKAKMAEVLKDLVQDDSPDLYDMIELKNDESFLEPLVFAYFNYPTSRFSLNQILWGYIEERASNTTVISGNQGEVYLPNYGYLLTQLPNNEFKLISENGVNQLITDGKNVDYEFNPVRKTPLLNAEIISYPNSLLSSLFQDEHSQKKVEVVTLNDETYSQNIQRSLEIIKLVNPIYFECLAATVRKFYCFRGTPNSFASISAQGIAFFNVSNESGLPFFLDNVIHQCGHIIFNAISFEKEKWFLCPPKSPLSMFTKDSKDHQDIYGRFHGLFTQTNINSIFEVCIEKKLLYGEDFFELLGRFSSNLTRFEVALNKLNHPNMYTPLGKEWFDFFMSKYIHLKHKWSDTIAQFKIDDQPYVFSYSKFKNSNLDVIKMF